MSALFELLYPPRCAFCGARGVRGVCAGCAARLPRLKQPLRTGASYGVCAAPLAYEGVARTALLRFKFRRARYAAPALGRMVAQCAAEELGGRFDVVTWVPTARGRVRRRGYDQSYLLARYAARVWDTKPQRLLRKLRNNPPQSGLSAAERRGNVLGAYAAAAPNRIRGRRILLIDDVITTGATLGECARVLREAGAESVVCACFASASTEK